MLDWLKPILGDGYNEEIDNKIAAEINKGFVAKADYDAAKDAQRTAAEALADANKALAEYKDTDIDGLRKSAEEWQAKAEQAEKDADARVAAVQFDAKLDSAIAAAHGRSGKAIRALLDLDALRGSQGHPRCTGCPAERQRLYVRHRGNPAALCCGHWPHRYDRRQL